MHFISEIKDYIGFDAEDAERLSALKPTLAPHFPAIVDAFYDALETNEHTRNLFEGPEQINRLRHSLEDWLDGVFTGPYDTEYFEKRQKIGRVHVDIGMRPEFMFGAMNIIRLKIIDIIKERSIELDTKNALRSVERILDLELTILLQAYWNEMMNNKVKSASALAAGLAHEILNPLNSMALNLTLLERQLKEHEDVAEEGYLEIIESVHSELRRIEGLSQEIKDFTKPVDIQPTWFDARDLLDDIEQAHGPTLSASDIELVTQIEGAPDIFCDSDRLKQVFINLIKNSAQSIDSEGCIAVRVDNKNEDGTRIEIEDDGHGMDPSTQYQIFDLFFTTKASGTGVGLPVVKKLIDAHDGSISVESKPGEGTKITIALPRPKKQGTETT